jgi:hypothetical protein
MGIDTFINHFIKEICDKMDIQNWSKEQLMTNKYFNTRIKGAIDAIRDNYDYKYEVRYSLKDEEGGKRNWEYLYDYCFLDTGKVEIGDGYFDEPNYIKYLIAAIEVEWSNNDREIMYDFNKLLLSKSILKIMIFFKKSIEEMIKIKDKMIGSIKYFEQKRDIDRYLICCSNDQNKKMNIFLINYNGELLKDLTN